jgi:hypothetical protein
MLMLVREDPDGHRVDETDRPRVAVDDAGRVGHEHVEHLALVARRAVWSAVRVFG